MLAGDLELLAELSCSLVALAGGSCGAQRRLDREEPVLQPLSAQAPQNSIGANCPALRAIPGFGARYTRVALTRLGVATKAAARMGGQLLGDRGGDKGESRFWAGVYGSACGSLIRLCTPQKACRETYVEGIAPEAKLCDSPSLTFCATMRGAGGGAKSSSSNSSEKTQGDFGVGAGAFGSHSLCTARKASRSRSPRAFPRQQDPINKPHVWSDTWNAEDLGLTRDTSAASCDEGKKQVNSEEAALLLPQSQLPGSLQSLGAKSKAVPARPPAKLGSAQQLAVVQTSPVLSLGVGRYASSIAGIPVVDPWGRDRGHLLERLSVCGAVILEARGEINISRLFAPPYARWAELLSEARGSRARFNARPCIDGRVLRLSGREDLQRTLHGDAKAHTPDDRVMFGLSDSALRSRWLDWGNLSWVLEDYAATKAVVASIFEREVAPLCDPEHDQPLTLGAKVRSGRETWSQSAFRHCVYPEGGACTEHTDYGVLTLQCCSADGLEVFIEGEWRLLHIPANSAVLFAGDMLERLTNGRTRALLHRVSLPPAERLGTVETGPADCLANDNRRASSATSRTQRPTVRQSQVLFLQPDQNTIVAPLRRFLRGSSEDLPPVRYGDWHHHKVSLAFGFPRLAKGEHLGARARSAAPDLRTVQSQTWYQ